MIQLKNVSKYYYSKGMIASGISKVNLNLEIGEFVVITGESGSGKSTLLNVISGLDSYEEGELYIDGQETSHYLASDFETYRKKYIGNIFQNFNLINSYTVYQNVELILLINGYKRDVVRSRVLKIINRVGLAQYRNTKVSKLSGGQKQRVAIARALAKDTDIIVADEPTGNLDSKAAEGIVKLLASLSRDKLVIVVTHNYDQFEAYATRKIKMHDGKIVEDEVLSASTAGADQTAGNIENADGKSCSDHEAAGITAGRKASGARDLNIRTGSKIKLGLRNTFNVIPKFILLFIVFLFVVVSVTSEYTTFRSSEDEAARLGYNEYFNNYSEDRVVLKKKDNSRFTEDDMRSIRSVGNIDTISEFDILLDEPQYLEKGDFSYEAFPRSIDEFQGKLIAGEMPQSKREAVLSGYEDDYYFNDPEMWDQILGKTYRLYIGENKEVAVKIVGLAHKQQRDENYYIYGGDLYLSNEKLKDIAEEVYCDNSTVTTNINGKEEEAYAPQYQLIPNDKVERGKAIVSEEVNNFYEKGVAKGKSIKSTAKNMYYEESVTMEIADVYTEKTFQSKTGLKDYSAYSGAIFVNKKDYDQLFRKGNYQISVYVKDVKSMEQTLQALQTMGYETTPLKDLLVNYSSELTSVIKVPIIVIIVLAIFFIAYFVIRLILKSRATYFSILRMLGMAKKNIRRILDIEMFVVVNIAYAVFLAVAILVNVDIIQVQRLQSLVAYLRVGDYVVLYGVLMVMAYLISGKFSRSLFKKTAMGTFREED